MLTYSEDTLNISETLQINSIVWIHSLPPNEMGPTNRLIGDIKLLGLQGGFPVLEYAVKDRTELADVFASVTAEAQKTLRPIIHIDAHGNADEGLLLSPSGECEGWLNLIEMLRTLNVATQNNLVVIFALCFGLHIYKQASLSRPVPAYFFGAPSNEITAGFLEDQTLEFYREVNRTSDLTSAFNRTLGKQMESFHCQGLFLLSLLRYIRKYCMGKGRRERLEGILTAILERDGITSPTSAQLREVRQLARERLKPSETLIERFAPIFLIGRSAAFTYADLNKLVKRDHRKGDQ